MKRIGGMVKYHAKREWKPVLIFFCCLLVIILAVTVYYSKDRTKVALGYGEGGTFYGIPVSPQEEQTFGYYSRSMSIDTDYSGLFVVLAIILTSRMIIKERRYLTSIGGTRWEILLAHTASTTLLSAALCALSYLLTVCARLLLLAFGFRYQTGWSAATILLGGSGDTLTSLAMQLAAMICWCGVFTLFLALWQRWWKILLILIGVGSTLLTVLVLQLSFDMISENTITTLERVIEWMDRDLIPFIRKWFIDVSQTSVFLRRIVIGIGCSALTYPVIVRMKLK